MTQRERPTPPLPEDLSGCRAEFQAALSASWAKQRAALDRLSRERMAHLFWDWRSKVANGISMVTYRDDVDRHAAELLAREIGLTVTRNAAGGELVVILGNPHEEPEEAHDDTTQCIHEFDFPSGFRRDFVVECKTCGHTEDVELAYAYATGVVSVRGDTEVMLGNWSAVYRPCLHRFRIHADKHAVCVYCARATTHKGVDAFMAGRRAAGGETGKSVIL